MNGFARLKIAFTSKYMIEMLQNEFNAPTLCKTENEIDREEAFRIVCKFSHYTFRPYHHDVYVFTKAFKAMYEMWGEGIAIATDNFEMKFID